MKAKYYLLIVFALFCSIQSKAQNTLDRIGLTSSTPASVAYSVRQLSTNYTGPLLRVKVGTSFYDVYPDTSTSIFSLNSKISAPIGTYNAVVGTATASALNTIIVSGTTNATVVVWYDQSGNGVNVFSAVNPSSPTQKIISLGTINTLFGLPTIYFDRNDWFVSSNTVNYSAQIGATVNAVAQNIATNSGLGGIIGTANAAPQPGYGISFDITTNYGYFSDGAGCNTQSTAENSTNPKILTDIFLNNTNNLSNFYVNGVLRSSSSSTCSIYTASGSKVYIGCARGYGSFAFNGNISESIIFPNQFTTGERNALESNQTSTYFSPFVSITSSATGAICGGASVTFTANAQNFFTTPSYQWYKNGVALAGANSTTFTTTSLANNDQINVTCSTATSIVSDNTLSLWLDAGNSSSYSGSGSTWTDLSGNSNNATLVNSPTFNSANQGSIEFNGTNYGVVNNPSSNLILGTSDFTLSWWQLASTNNPNTRLFGNINNSSWSANNWVVTQNFSAANTIGYYANNSNLYPVLSATTIPQTWQNIVVSRSGNTWSIYLNNVLISSSSSSFSVDGGLSKPFYIGTSGWITSDGYWNGKIANITLYRKALSSTERLQNYNAIAGRFGLISSNSFTSNTITTTVTALPSATVTVAGDACINKTTLSVPTGMTSYAWYKDNAAISGATSNSYIPTSGGAFSVLVTNGTCSSTSSPNSIFVCGLTADGSMSQLETSTTLVSKEGALNNGKGIDENGKILSKPWIYGTVTTRTGRIWMDRNLGASRVALNSTDTQAYGDYYQWGRPADGHEKHIVSGSANDYTTIRSTTTVPVNNKYIFPSDGSWDWLVTPNNNLWTGVNAPNNPCPAGFRIPTEAEWAAEAAVFTSNNVGGSFEAGYGLKLTVGGMATSQNNITAIGNYGQYLTQTAYDDGRVKYFGVISWITWFDTNYYKTTGQSCRCIKN